MRNQGRAEYKAKQGDIVWLDLDPQVGSEISGRRPALIVSNNQYNKNTAGRAMVCPITNTNRGWMMHIDLVGTRTTGTVMCDQAKVLDIKQRKAEFIESIPRVLLGDIVAMVSATLEMGEQQREFAVTVETDDSGKIKAYVPELLNCEVVSDDVATALTAIQALIGERLKSHANNGEQIYNPKHVAVVMVEA